MADPNFEEIPDFTDAGYEDIRNALSAAHIGDNQEQIIARLTIAWQAGHTKRLDAWNVRKAAEVHAAAEQERLNRAQRVLDEQAAAEEAERARLDAESKKPKMNVFTPGTAAPDILSLPPSQYALQKISTFDFVELWYFSFQGRTDAAKYCNKSTADDTFGISKVDDHLTVRSIASVRASKNVLPDHELSFPDFLQAKNTFLDFAKKADWPQANLDALAKFFWFLEISPLHQVPLGQKTILTYAARVRLNWHRELKAGRGYDISVINSRLMSTVSDEIRAIDDQHTKSQASVLRLKPCASIDTDALFPFSPLSRVFTKIPTWHLWSPLLPSLPPRTRDSFASHRSLLPAPYSLLPTPKTTLPAIP